MTPTEAARILESLSERYREPRALEALRLAVEALRHDPATTAQAVLNASGRTDATMALLRSDDGDHWIAWLHKGPMVSSKSLPEALEGLLEKVTQK